MAIVQISKIQQRAGNLVDLPQLDNAEFGWATDENRLFIGRTGNTYTDQNIEVLTSYSNISFSQISGSDGGNFNITTPLNGQLLTYVSSTDTWENYTGLNTQLGGTKLQLGNVSNLSMTGGAIGYVLQTDGSGNLSWTPKNTLYTPIVSLSTATPIIMTVANTTPYTNGQTITITGVNGVANANVNGLTFYLTLLANYASSGQVALYTDIARTTGANGTSLTYTNSPNAIATASLGGSGSGTVGGANTTVQFNDQNVLTGNASFTYNKLTNTLTISTGNVDTGNLNATTTVTASRLVSNVATGTAPLTVTSTTRVSNLSVAYANVSDYEVVTTQTTGTFYPVFVSGNSTANYAAASNANLSFNAATGALSATLLTGKLTTAAQGNITSVGTLSNLNVTSNTTSGNFVGRLANGNSNVYIATANGNVNISAVGNANILVVTGTGANITGTANITGNANVLNLGTTRILASGNITATQLISNIADGTAPFVVTSTTQVANLNVATAGSATNAAAVQTNTSTTTTVYLAGVTSSSNGNSALNIVSGISANMANNAISATTFVGNLVGSVTTAAQGNITSLGTLTALTIGNATANTQFGNGTINAAGNANVGNLGTTQAFASANITAPQFISNVADGTAPLVVTSTTQVANLNSATAGTVRTAAQGNITSVGSLTGLTVSNATGVVDFVTTANVSLGAVANVHITGGSANQLLATDGAGNLSWTDPNGGYYLHTQVSAATTWTVTHNLNRQYLTVEPIDSSGNSYTGRYDYPTINYTNANSFTMTFLSAVAGYAAVTGGGTNINSVSVGNSTPGGVNTQVQFNDAGNLAGSSGLVYDKTTGTLTATLLTSTLTTAAQPNITSVGTLTSLGVNGTITANTVVSNVATGTAPFTVTSTTQVANLNAATSGTVRTAAQPNITSVGTLTSLSVTGTTTSGNFATAGNITASFLVSNVATGTAPFRVTSTTQVANLSVANAGAVQTNTSTSTTVYLSGVTSSSNGYSALNIVSGISANMANNAISATTFVGNLSGSVTTAAQANITSVGALTSLEVTGNANINTGTPVAYDTTGSIITGRMLGRYANRSGNVNYYFADYNASNVITSADAAIVLKLGSILDTTVGNSNISMAVGTNYGSKTAGVAFVSGTATDVNTIAAGGPPSYTGNINAVLLGYPTVGPRILIQDYALADDSPNVITHIGTTHSFIGNITTSGNLTLANNSIISMGANTNVGTLTGNFSLSAGSRLQATYADLAEYYEADKPYEPGTVLEFGGDKEVTIAEDGTTRVAGVVSTNPAYIMNSTCVGEHVVALALQGRVPCKVRGTIRKGDMLVSAGEGYARPMIHPYTGSVIGKALANFEGEGVIEVAVGRL